MEDFNSFIDVLERARDRFYQRAAEAGDHNANPAAAYQQGCGDGTNAILDGLRQFHQQWEADRRKVIEEKFQLVALLAECRDQISYRDLLARIDRALPVCHDCKAKPGELHDSGCDVEQCPECGGQWIQCGCRIVHPRLIWTGGWPREANAIELGLVDQDGKPETDRLRFEARWDAAQGKYVRR